jgi:peptidoglycan-N-acetylglucosamine deacetylase
MAASWLRALIAAGFAAVGVIVAMPAEAAAPVPKTVYFTFDDGPGAGTAELLDAAAQYDAKVSLFELGTYSLAHPELTARAAAEGHIIGNHTYDHRQLNAGLTPAEIRDELVRGQEALSPYVSNCWRPPRWETNSTIEQIGKDLGLRQTLWAMNMTAGRHVFVPESWTDADQIVKQVENTVYDGAIVTLHAEGANTGQLQAFIRLLPILTARGYIFRALPYCNRPTATIMAVGDSTTATGSAEGPLSTYRAQLDFYLRNGAEPRGFNYRWVGPVAGQPAVGLNHAAYPGQTIQGVYAAISGWQATYAPDVILLNIGADNLWRGEDAATAAGRLSTLLQRIRLNQPRVQVLVAQLSGWAGYLPAAVRARDSKFATQTSEIVRAAGEGFYDVDLRRIGGEALYDAIRPNRFGGAEIAYQNYQALRGVLPGSNTWTDVSNPWAWTRFTICHQNPATRDRQVCKMQTVNDGKG